MTKEQGDQLVELAKVYSQLGPKDSQGRKYVRGLIDLLNPASLSEELLSRVAILEDRVSKLETASSFRLRSQQE